MILYGKYLIVPMAGLAMAVSLLAFASMAGCGRPQGGSAAVDPARASKSVEPATSAPAAGPAPVDAGREASPPTASAPDGHSPDAGEGHDHAAPDSAYRFSDAEEWARRFEDPGRDAWQKPDHVLEVLGLARDARVADIGSGTGYFPVRFARAVPEGKVYGLDIEQGMVDYLNWRAGEEGLTNLESRLATADDPNIPEPVDVIFLCNTYHHISDRPAYFRALRDKLRPAGRVVIVDFQKRELPVGPPPARKLLSNEVAREMRAAGYELLTRDVALPYQYLLVFGARGE